MMYVCDDIHLVTYDSVTAVGATQGPEAGTAEIAESSSTGGLFTTCGGFSTVWYVVTSYLITSHGAHVHVHVHVHVRSYLTPTPVLICKLCSGVECGCGV